MWDYTGSAPGTSHPPALAFALVQHLLCRLHAPRGAHQHLLPQLQHWTRSAPRKRMGKGPAAPSGASSVVTTWTLTPSANRLFFGCFSCVIHACWNLSPILLFSKAGSGKEHHKTITFLILFCVSPGLLSQKDEQGEMISSGEPFLLSKIIWERICYITILLLNCQPDTWEHSYQHGLEKFFVKWLSFPSSSFCRKKIDFWEKF